MTQTAAKPADRWDLNLIAEVEVDGEEYVVYSDGMGRWAVPESTWGDPTIETDYSEWCSMSDAVSDPALCARIAQGAGLEGILAAGSGAWVTAALTETRAAALLGRKGGRAKSPAKQAASRANGRKGGRPPKESRTSQIHVTRVTASGEVYGHETKACDPAGCAGFERYLGLVEGAEEKHVYEIKDRRIVAEIR